MKRKLLSLVVATLPLVGAIYSCQPQNSDEPDVTTLSLSVNAVTLDAQAISTTTPQIGVTTNYQNWEVTDNAEWLNALRQGDGIILSASANTIGKERTADVLVFAGSTMKKIVVTQRATDLVLELSPADLKVGHEGGRFIIDVNTGGADWSVETEGAVQWLEHRPMAGGKLLELTVAKNMGNEERTAKLYVLSGNTQKELLLTQASRFLSKNTLPLLKSMAPAYEITNFETGRGSFLVKYSGALPHHGFYKEEYHFLTTSPTFQLIRYERTVDDGRLNVVIMETDKIEYATSEEYKNFLISEGFEISKWDAASKKFEGDNKDLQYKVVIEPNADGITGKATFTYYAVQKVDYPTFSSFPYYHSDMLNVTNYAQINAWELERGSKFVKEIKSNDFKDQVGAAMYMTADDQKPVISTFYHFFWDKDWHTGMTADIWVTHDKIDLVYWDNSENNLGKWVMTREFTALLQQEGFELLGYTESNWPCYVNLEKNLTIVTIVARYKDLNNGSPVLELVYSLLDPTVGAAAKTDAGKKAILGRVSKTLASR